MSDPVAELILKGRQKKIILCAVCHLPSLVSHELLSASIKVVAGSLEPNADVNSFGDAMGLNPEEKGMMRKLEGAGFLLAKLSFGKYREAFICKFENAREKEETLNDDERIELNRNILGDVNYTPRAELGIIRAKNDVIEISAKLSSIAKKALIYSCEKMKLGENLQVIWAYLGEKVENSGSRQESIIEELTSKNKFWELWDVPGYGKIVEVLKDGWEYYERYCDKE